jgi:putative chitinase
MIGPLVKSWQEFLNKNGFSSGKADGIFGKNTEAATKAFQESNNLKADGIVGPKTLNKAKGLGYEAPEADKPDKKDKKLKAVKLEQLAYIMKYAKRSTLELHLPFSNDCMKFCAINTPLRIAHFLAQVGHESASLKYMHEIASGAAYEGRADLGNTQPGDGRKFRGHGPIQLTGRLNHQSFFNYINRPELIDTPEILETDLGLAWKASGWFWMSRKLNKYADEDNVRAITLRINGGYNGLEDRKQYLKRAKEVVG